MKLLVVAAVCIFLVGCEVDAGTESRPAGSVTPPSNIPSNIQHIDGWSRGLNLEIQVFRYHDVTCIVAANGYKGGTAMHCVPARDEVGDAP